MGLKIRKALNYAENDNLEPMCIHKRQKSLAHPFAKHAFISAYKKRGTWASLSIYKFKA